MWMMLQQEEASDFVIGSGETHSVREFCEIAFGCVGLDYRDHVIQDPKFYRPAEVDLLISDPSRARTVLKWEPSVTFRELVEMMVQADVQQLTDLHKKKFESQV
jgi:GDPmannose 4,6-dehydratase